MVSRYGKAINMQKINRNMKVKQELMDITYADTMKFCNFDAESNHKCRICGSNHTRLYMRAFEKVEYYECQDCQTVFIGNVPDTTKMYENDKSSATVYLSENIYLDRVNMIAKPKVDWILDVLERNNISVNNWIDIGCGNGELLYYLQNIKEIACEGVETDSAEYQFCKSKGLSVTKMFINTEDEELVKNIIKNKQVISFFNFLEHLEEPDKFVKAIYQYMDEGAVIAFEVPRHPSLASFANMSSVNKIYRHICPPYHLYVFGEKGIEKLLEDKFKLIGKWGFGQGFLDLMDNAMIATGKDKDDIYDKILEISNRIQAYVDEAGFSDTMIYVAQKKK